MILFVGGRLVWHPRCMWSCTQKAKRHVRPEHLEDGSLVPAGLSVFTMEQASPPPTGFPVWPQHHTVLGPLVAFAVVCTNLQESLRQQKPVPIRKKKGWRGCPTHFPRMVSDLAGRGPVVFQEWALIWVPPRNRSTPPSKPSLAPSAADNHVACGLQIHSSGGCGWRMRPGRTKPLYWYSLAPPDPHLCPQWPAAQHIYIMLICDPSTMWFINVTVDATAEPSYNYNLKIVIVGTIISKSRLKMNMNSITVTIQWCCFYGLVAL